MNGRVKIVHPDIIIQNRKTSVWGSGLFSLHHDFPFHVSGHRNIVQAYLGLGRTSVHFEKSSF